MLLDTFEISLVDIDEVDIDKLHALTIGVEWHHRAEDWRQLREMGHGWAAVDTIGRVLGSVMWFPFGDKFAIIGMGITTPRLQARGANTWMMQQVFEHLKGYDLGLVSTHEAHRLYLSLGFKDAGTIHRRQGIVQRRDTDSFFDIEGKVRALEELDLDDAIELDAEAFGESRSKLIAGLAKNAKGFALERSGNMVAFAFCRPFGRGYIIGPVVAKEQADAIAVVEPHIRLHEGNVVRIDTQLSEGPFVDFLGSVGLQPLDSFTAMWKGSRVWGKVPQITGSPVTFALGSQSFG